MILKVAPGRIAVKKIEAKLKGGISLPVSRAKAYDLGEIVAVGRLDKFGYRGEEKTAEDFKIGDIVLFQLPINIATLGAHRVKDVMTMFLRVPEIIARLDRPTTKEAPVIDMSVFHIAGKNILVKPQVRQLSKVIITPETATEANKESLHFSVLQKGADVTVDVYTGQEVYPHRARVNPLVVDTEEVAFVDQEFIDGVLAEE
jgi:co-chaperonin GroES (HSP10)